MRTSRQVVGAFLLGGMLSAGALAVRAHAAGVPAAPGLTYTGYLEDAEGAPITKAVSIAVEVYDAAEAGKRVCDVSKNSVEPVFGRFQIELPDDCTSAVHDSADLWVDVKVEGSSLGRTKLGAVPYALEADRASGAAGALEARLQKIESRLGARSALSLSLSKNLALESGKPVPVPFDTVLFDLGGEFDKSKHAFVPKTDGYYYISCSLTFEGPTTTSAYFRAQVFVNGEQRAIAGYETPRAPRLAKRPRCSG